MAYIIHLFVGPFSLSSVVPAAFLVFPLKSSANDKSLLTFIIITGMDGPMIIEFLDRTTCLERPIKVYEINLYHCEVGKKKR